MCFVRMLIWRAGRKCSRSAPTIGQLLWKTRFIYLPKYGTHINHLYRYNNNYKILSRKYIKTMLCIFYTKTIKTYAYRNNIGKCVVKFRCAFCSESIAIIMQQKTKSVEVNFNIGMARSNILMLRF